MTRPYQKRSDVWKKGWNRTKPDSDLNKTKFYQDKPKQQPNYEIPKDMEQFLKETPDFVNKMADGRGPIKTASVKIASCLLAKGTGFCITLTLTEFSEMFHAPHPKKAFGLIKKYMKEAGIAKPKIVRDSDRIYITKNDF